MALSLCEIYGKATGEHRIKYGDIFDRAVRCMDPAFDDFEIFLQGIEGAPGCRDRLAAARNMAEAVCDDDSYPLAKGHVAHVFECLDRCVPA